MIIIIIVIIIIFITIITIIITVCSTVLPQTVSGSPAVQQRTSLLIVGMARSYNVHAERLAPSTSLSIVNESGLIKHRADC